MSHTSHLSKRLDLSGRPTCLESIPGCEQLRLMDFGPRFNQAALLLMKATANELDGVDCEDTDLILIVGMEVRSMVRRCRLGEHADDDPEESGDLRHPSFESHKPMVLSIVAPNELSHTENCTLPAFARSTSRSGYVRSSHEEVGALRATRRMQVNA
jgi:hypothetical protein